MVITAMYAEERGRLQKIVPVCPEFWRCPAIVSGLFPDVYIWMEKHREPFETGCLAPGQECCFKKYLATEEELEWAPAKIKELEREKDMLHKRIRELEESR